MTETQWTVEVDMSLARPIRHDATVTIVLMASDWMQAELTAIDIAHSTMQSREDRNGKKLDVMPIGSRIIDWEE